MQSIRIENLRSFKDTGDVQIKPFTILVGQNSSGKSTFLRTFPLLRQSIELRTRGPILWYGQYVDMGDFKTALNNNSKSKEIRFHFHFPLIPSNYRSQSENQLPLDVKFMMGISHSAKRDEALINKYEIELSGHKIQLGFREGNKISSLSINQEDFTSEAKNLIGIQREMLICFLSRSNREGGIFSDQPDSIVTGTFLDRIKEIVNRYVHKNTSPEKTNQMIRGFAIGTSEAMLTNIKKNHGATGTWRSRVSNWETNTDTFVSLQNAIIAFNLVRVIDSCDQYISSFARQVKYIAPLRASAERYYRIQNLSIDELDHMGQNLPTFLRHLSSLERSNFANWMNEHFGFSVKVPSSDGHISLKLTGAGAKTDYNLTDMGFGFSQILPIIIQAWSYTYGRRFRQYRSISRRRTQTYCLTMEQPELHLHPHLQAYLADALVSILSKAKEDGLDLRLIMETHSETIINRLGENIAENNISHDDINVVLFDKADTDANSTVNIGKYDDEGFMTNWPFGFFEPSPVKHRGS